MPTCLHTLCLAVGQYVSWHDSAMSHTGSECETSAEVNKSVTLTVRPTVEERSLIHTELAVSSHSETADKVRIRLQKERAGLLAAYFQDEASPNRMRGLDMLVDDNRAALDELERLQASILNTQREERVLELSERQADQAKALKVATWALVLATVALIFATIIAAIL